MVLHFHLTDQAVRGNGVVRPEHGDPMTLDQLIEFLASTGCQIRVQPVLDPAGTAPIDGYEVSPRLRAAVRYWQVADVFPFGSCTSPTMDLDHTEPYVPTDYGGPPGQTRLGNLGPMGRSSTPRRHPRRLAETPARTRLLRAPLTLRLHLPGHQPRHPRTRPNRLQPSRLERRTTSARCSRRLAGPATGKISAEG